MQFVTLLRQPQQPFRLYLGATFTTERIQNTNVSAIRPDQYGELIEVSDALLASKYALYKQVTRYDRGKERNVVSNEVTIRDASLRWDGIEGSRQILVPPLNRGDEALMFCVHIPGFEYDFSEQSRPIYRQIIRRGLVALGKGESVDVRIRETESRRVAGKWLKYEDIETTVGQFTVLSDGKTVTVRGAPFEPLPPLCFA